MSVATTATKTTKRKLEPSWFCVYDVYDLNRKDFDEFDQHIRKYQLSFNENNLRSIRCIIYVWDKLILAAFYNMNQSIKIDISTPPGYFVVHDPNIVLGIGDI